MTPDQRTTRLKEALADALHPALAGEARGGGPHPEVEELVRYHGGELDDAAEERLQSHLVACPECLEDLLDLDGLVAAGADRRDGADDLARARPAGPLGSRPGAPSRRPALALAASLVLAVAGLGFWLAHERQAAGDLRRQVAALSAPRPDVPILDLLPDSSVRGEAVRRQPVELPASEEHATLVLNLPQASELTAFEVELVGPDGEVSWSGPLERSRYGTFTLGIWRSSLAPGENAVLLYGIDGGERRLLESYTLRVKPGAEEEP